MVAFGFAVPRRRRLAVQAKQWRAVTDSAQPNFTSLIVTSTLGLLWLGTSEAVIVADTLTLWARCLADWSRRNNLKQYADAFEADDIDLGIRRNGVIAIPEIGLSLRESPAAEPSDFEHERELDLSARIIFGLYRIHPDELPI